ASEGEFYPFHQEQADGYDTVEWVAGQPWSDGNVGVLGPSYLGCTAWQAALAQPPHLKAVAPLSTAVDYHDGWVYQGGALLLDFALGWGLGVVAQRLGAVKLSPDEIAVRSLLRRRDGAEALYTALASERPRLRRILAPFLFDWLENLDDGAYWQPIKVAENAGRITVPAFNVGGWYDIFQEGPGLAYRALRAGGGSPAACGGQR